MPNHDGGPPNGLPGQATDNIEENLDNLPDETQDLLNELLGVGGADEVAFFSGNDFSIAGTEPWYFDGETAGLLVDIKDGFDSSNPTDFILFGDDLYFEADSSDGSTRHLYKLDATLQTVSLVEYQGVPLELPSDFLEFEGDVYFAASTPATGEKLFKIDGGTGDVSAFEIAAGGTPYDPGNLTAFNGELYFTEGIGNLLYKLDETNDQPVQIVDVNGGGTLSVFPTADLIVYNDALYFGGFSTDLVTIDHELLRIDTDGTLTKVPDGGANPSNFFEFEGNLYYSAETGNTGIDAFKYDGTTVMQLEIATGEDDANNSHPREFIAVDGNLFVVATTAATGQEVFYLDESGETPQWVAIDINSSNPNDPSSPPNPSSSQPSDLTEFNGDLFLNSDEGVVRIDGADGQVIDTGALFEDMELLGAVDDKLALVSTDFFNPGLFAYDGTDLTLIDSTLFFIGQFTVEEGDSPIIV